MAIKIDNLEFENLGIEAQEIAGAAFILGEALYESGSTMHSNAAFAIYRHLEHVRNKIDGLLNECQEDD